MTRRNSIVEVNGNRYDAITGELINKVKKASAGISRQSGRKLVDGFVLPAHGKSQNSKRPTASTPRPKISSPGLHTGREKSRTLMRRAVKKPSSLKVVQPHQPQTRDTSVNPVRVSRAKTVIKHSAVNRFGFLRNSSAQDVPQPVDLIIKSASGNKSTTSSETLAPKAPSMITSVSHQKLERLLDEALFSASAHKQMMNSSRHARLVGLRRLPKRLSISVALLILMVIAAVLIWQNLPSVAVHVAAARAHVNASMPGYTPTGYSLASPIKYGNGSLTMQYVDKSHAGDGFALTQKTSNWDSSSLAANTLPKNAPVQTVQANGTTVYIYGASNDATWANHGVVYSLNNKANLSSDQVMKIVSSL